MTCGLQESTSICSLYLCLQNSGLADFRMSVTQVLFLGGGERGAGQLTGAVQ